MAETQNTGSSPIKIAANPFGVLKDKSLSTNSYKYEDLDPKH